MGRGCKGREHRTTFTTEIYNRLYSNGKSNTITKLQSPLLHTLGNLCISAGNQERHHDNQAYTSILSCGYLHLLIGCFTDDNYLSEYRIPK